MSQISIWINSKKPFNFLILSLIILCTLFIVSHVIFLDSDLPVYQISQYQPIDELYYTLTAFNLYHYYEWQPQILPYVESDSQTPNLLGNIFCFFTLKNYLEGRTLHSFKFSADYVYVITIICLLYFLSDFSFLLAGRIMEPTIFRMLALVFIIYILSSRSASKLITNNLFVCCVGFLSTVTVLYVYPTNAFIIPAAFITCISAGLLKGHKKIFTQICFFLLGVTICVLSYEIFLKIFFHSSIMDDIARFSVFSNKISFISNSKSSGLMGIFGIWIYNFFNLFYTNIFKFNPILLIIFLISLPLLFFNITKRQKTQDIFLASLIIIFFVQSAFLSDYPYRKGVIILPMVLIIIAVAIVTHEEFFTDLKNNSKRLAIFMFYCAFCVCFTLGVFFIHRTDIIQIICFIFVLQLIFIVVLMVRKKNLSKIILIGVLILIMMPNIYLGVKYVYSDPNYHYRDTMIELSDYVNDEIIVGGMAHGFRLYTTSIPILNPYAYVYTIKGRESYRYLQEKMIGEKKAQYTILYHGDYQPDALSPNNIIYKDKLDLVYVFNLNQKEYGGVYDIGLYKFR